MRKNALLLSTSLLFTAGCTTLNESMKLGGTMGAVAGLASVHAGYDSAGIKPTSDQLTGGALIGLTAGLIAAYVTHNEVAENREDPLYGQPEVQFGDLPPSPFVFQNPNQKGRR